MSFGRLVLSLAAVAALAAPVSAQSFVGGEEAPAFLADFGGAIAMADGQIIVGEGGNTVRPGMVYVHEKQGGEWLRTARLTASDAAMADGFGRSLSVTGDQMLVGGTNGVYVFARSGQNWTEVGRLAVGEGAATGTGFGIALAAEGDWALVGEPGAGEGAGAVHLFRRTGTAWAHATSLTLPQGAPGDLFGASVALEDGLALVGAPGRQAAAGAVGAWRVGTGEPEFLGTLDTGAGAENDRLGASVAVLNGVAFAGATGSGGTGAVFAFGWSDETERWVPLGRWTAFDGIQQQGRRPGTSFGTDVVTSGGAIWIGSSTGAYVFDVDADLGIRSVSKETAGELGGGFGSTLAAAGSVVAVAAPRADYGVGQVVVYENGQVTSVLGSEPEEFNRVAGGEIDCADNRAADWVCSEVNLVSYLPISELAVDGTRGLRTNDNWGWQDPETGRTYALVGMTDRTSFVDITDGTNPRVVGIMMMPEGANGSAWRDMKTFGDHVFVVSDGAGPHGMQIFDLTRLRNHTTGDPVFFEEDVHYDRIASAHNVVINTEIGHAYIVGARGGGETCGGGLHIVDVNDPRNPTFAGCFSDPQTGRAGTGYTHDAQCVVYRGPDEAWQGRSICLGSNETALSIADVTDPANPVRISSATYPSVAYSHQGWLTEDHRWFYMNDELDEIGGLVPRTRTLIWDLENLDDPILAGEHLSTEEASDHNLYVVGNLMFQSNYKAGLRILDISDPANPVEVGFFDTVPYGDNSPGTSGAWSNYPFFGDGTVISTGGSEGLFLLRPTLQNVVF
jgi:choice-of-anchor B domain-containing protein